MNTDCKQKKFEFQALGTRKVEAKFDGGYITSDGGALLLRETEERFRIIERFAECFTDYRDPSKLEHTVKELVSQRVHGIALGYEDLVDHDELRLDPLMAVLAGKQDPTGQDRKRVRDKGNALAGKSTLNRMELTPSDADCTHRYKKIVMQENLVDDLLVDAFLKKHEKPPECIILDFDATDDPLHGNQEGKFYHGYYREYCYLPLYVFCGNDILCARLRPSGIDASEGTVEELERIVGHIRSAWPDVRIIVRGDSGFCREAIMKWCEENGVDFLFGLAKNSRLIKLIHNDLEEAKSFYEATGKGSRVFTEFLYRTLKSWSRLRRVVAKAEYLPKGANPRFVVTSISKKEICGRTLYEQLYCARGNMENRIKEQQLCLFADRTSSAKMRANQLRLYFSTIAYILVNMFREIGLEGTSMARAQCGTIRLKLFKIGALVQMSVRRIAFSYAGGYPYKMLYAIAQRKIRAVKPSYG